MDRIKIISALLVALALAASVLTTGATYGQQATPSESAVTVVTVEVEPERPAPGAMITVTASVINDETSAVQETLKVIADNVVLASQLVTLSPGEAKDVRFTFEAPESQFTSITVGDVTELIAFAVPEEVEYPSAGVMRVGPSVRLHTVRNQITSSQDALVDLFWSNSELNDLPVRIEVSLDVPSGLFVYSQDGALACSAGRCMGMFESVPGTVINMPIVLKTDSVGEYMVRLTARYWPAGQRERWTPISLSIPVNAVQESPAPTDPIPTDHRDAQGWTSQPEDTRPWYVSPVALVGYSILAIVAIAIVAFVAIAGSVRAARQEAPAMNVIGPELGGRR